jgi:hypothetical protein
LADNKTIVIYVSGAAIAVAWIWFALIGINAFDTLTALFIPLAITIILGALIGAIQVKGSNE